MTFFGKRGDWAASLGASPDMSDSHAHDETGDGHDDHGHPAAHESPQVMLVPLAVLAFGAVVAGVAFRYWFIGGGFEGFWKHALFSAPTTRSWSRWSTFPRSSRFCRR